MSKIEIKNTYERNNTNEKRRDTEFYKKLIELNEKNISDGNILYDNNSGYEGYGDLLVLPDGYYPITSDYIDNVYIADLNNVLYKIQYYPGLEKDYDGFNDTSVITKMSKQKTYLEKEYILERAAFLTEDKYGDDNKNQLIHAIENIQDGNYASFTNREHGRDKLKQIPADEISQLIKQILYKYDIINKNTYIISESDIRELFVTYIKEKVKKYRKTNNVLTLTDLLTNIEDGN
ncbi:MAG: hypothetical protein J6O56_01965 [Bacilli bacterium]|nr:hypothetical protein [Bacilli bacterium]